VSFIWFNKKGSGLIILALIVSLASCRTTKKTITTEKKPVKTEHNKSAQRNDLILKKAKSFTGTPWKLGGNDKSGIDCSGLVVQSFKEAGVELPRRSVDQSHVGKEVSLKQVQKGDLLFFAFDYVNKESINHVGIVSKVEDTDHIYFVHTSRKKGVMESCLCEEHFKKAFVKATRP
jgi:hypothetical protein